MRGVKKKKNEGWEVDDDHSGEILSNVALGFSIFVFILAVVTSFLK